MNYFSYFSKISSKTAEKSPQLQPHVIVIVVAPAPAPHGGRLQRQRAQPRGRLSDGPQRPLELQRRRRGEQRRTVGRGNGD